MTKALLSAVALALIGCADSTSTIPRNYHVAGSSAADRTVVPECQARCLQALADRDDTSARCTWECSVTAYVRSRAQLETQLRALSARVAARGRISRIVTPGGPQAATGLGLALASGDKVWLRGCSQSVTYPDSEQVNSVSFGHSESDWQLLGRTAIVVGAPVDLPPFWHARVRGKNVLAGGQLGLGECLVIVSPP